MQSYFKKELCNRNEVLLLSSCLKAMALLPFSPTIST